MTIGRRPPSSYRFGGREKDVAAMAEAVGVRGFVAGSAEFLLTC
jgi:hypothetical protein